MSASLSHRKTLVAAAVLAAVAAVALALTLATGPADAKRGGKAPETIPLPPGWQPEGIAAGRGNELFVGSIPTGRILRIDARTGESEVLVPQRDGRAAIGLKADRDRIFVAGGPTGHAFVYDARTGADVADVTLTAAPTFINDVALTKAAAYFTDSQRPQLYRLPRAGDGAPAAQATPVPITGDLQYDEDPQTFEANGIAATKDGKQLLVVQSRTGGLFRVDPQTGASDRVELTGGAEDGRLTNADGILLQGRTLYVVQNRSNQIAVVRLASDLQSGRIERVIRDDDFRVPTTIARLGGDLFAVNARFGTPPTPTTEYEVVRVSPKAAKTDRGRRSGREERRRSR